MNAIYFLSNALPVPEETQVKEEASVIEEEPVEKVDTDKDVSISTNRILARWLWSILIFLPYYLLIKPISTIWYVITFPLNLMETNTKDKRRLKGDMNTESRGHDGNEELSNTYKMKQKSSKYHIEDDLSPNDEIIINEDKMKPKPISETLGKFHFPKKLVPQSMLLSSSRKLLILDLDETLIHSMSSSRSSSGANSSTSLGDKNPGATTPIVHYVEVRFPQTNITSLYNVAKRPYCDMFLQHTSQWYDIAIFTASMKEYADPVIDWLEQTCSIDIKYRWYRDHCTLRPGVGYVKDIGTVVNQIETRELSQMIIIDNSPISYAMHLDNAIQVHGWINDPSDCELLHLLPLLKAMRHVTDSRCILALKSGRASIST
ncbi:Nuclear envelope morphology protein 1 [Kluyveromyces marxianus]